MHTNTSFNDSLKYDYERKDIKGINGAKKLSIRSQIIITKSRNEEEKHKIHISLQTEIKRN